MIKAKFRDHVRGKTDIAMKNEVLCKVLCHNTCCLISAIHELGITPTFSFEDKAPRVVETETGEPCLLAAANSS